MGSLQIGYLLPHLGLLRLAMLGLIAVFSVYSIGNHYFNVKYAKEDARSTARFLEEEGKDNDVITVLAIWSALDY